MRGSAYTLLAFVTLLAAPPAAKAADGMLRHKSLVGLRYNRLGLSWFADQGYRVPLSQSRSMLLKDTYIEAGATWMLSPANFHPGAYVEAVPLAPLQLRVQASQLRYFGTYTAFHEFAQGTEADWSDEALDAIEDSDDKRHETGVQIDGRATLRLKFGRILALFENRLTYFLIPDMAQANTWYETYSDTLLAREDAIHTMFGTLGFLLWGDTHRDMLLIGARYHRDATFETEVERQILTGAILWRPSRSSWYRGAKPTFGLLAGAYLDDPYRSGEPTFSVFSVTELEDI